MKDPNDRQTLTLKYPFPPGEQPPACVPRPAQEVRRERIYHLTDSEAAAVEALIEHLRDDTQRNAIG